MGLILPVPADDPGPTTGPLWAHELNSAFSLVDSHDHTAGAGSPIGLKPSGGLMHAPGTQALGILLDGATLTLGAGGISVTNPVTGTNTGDVTIGTANGLSLLGQVLSLALAVAGGANGALLGTDKTKLDNTSGINTGDVTISNANGLSLLGQALSMNLATAANIGTVSTVAQTFAGAKTFTSAILGQPEAEALLGGGSPTFANTYVVVYNVDTTVNIETWTATVGAFLRKRLDYTYGVGGVVSTIRTRVYSAADGVTVVGDMTETFSYSGGQVTGSTTTRAI